MTSSPQEPPQDSAPFPDPAEPAGSGQSAAGAWQRDEKAKSPLPDFFHGELMTIYDGLGRLCRRQREQKWFKRLLRVELSAVFGWIATVAFGGFVTGVLTWITLRDTQLSQVTKHDLRWFLILSGLVSLLAGFARLGIKEKEAESVYGIYRFVGNILATYTPTSETKKRNGE